MAKADIPKKILLIDDDQTLTEILAMKLRQRGYAVSVANNGHEGVSQAQKQLFDGIVLDLNMPEKDGFRVCRELREEGVITPILVLSGVTDKLDIVQVLDLGADEYLTKPFDGDELTARLRALIRRNSRMFDSTTIRSCGITLHVHQRRIECGELSEQLTPTEVILLSRLMQHSPSPVTRRALFEEVWGIDDSHTSNRLDAYIKRLRTKLSNVTPNSLIHTMHAGGYFFSATPYED